MQVRDGFAIPLLFLVISQVSYSVSLAVCFTAFLDFSQICGGSYLLFLRNVFTTVIWQIQT